MSLPSLRPSVAPDTLARVFHHLLVGERMSRAELAEITGLTRTTIGSIVDHLVNAGLVAEVGRGKSQGGRPPIMVECIRDAVFAFGVSMQDLRWNAVVTDLDARIVARHEVEMIDQTAESAIAAIEQAYRATIAKLPSSSHLLPTVGIGSPGVVDMNTGTVHGAVDLGWETVELGAEIEARLGVPALVANRSRVGALAEIWRQQVRGSSEGLVYVTVGTGVAAGIVYHGKLIRGANSSAGELGHVVVVPDGPVCGCGNRGCLQTLASEHAIVTRANSLAIRRGLPEYKRAADVIVGAQTGEDAARRAVDEAGRHLATAIGALINILNPAEIVLGGPMADAGPELADAVRRHLASRAMDYPLSAVAVRNSRFGPDSSAIGAAVMVVQRTPDLLFAQ